MDFNMTWDHPTQAQIDALHHVCKCLHIKLNTAIPMRVQALSQVNRRAWASDDGIDDPKAYALGPYDYAEMMLMADKSLWYIQAEGWAAGDTPQRNGRGSKVSPVFEKAGETIVKLVDWGYHDSEWWNPLKVWDNKFDAALRMSTILEAANLLDVLSHVPPQPTGDPMSNRGEWADWINFLTQPPELYSGAFQSLPMLFLPGLDTRWLRKILASNSKDSAKFVLAEILAHYDPEFRKNHNAAKKKAREDLAATYEPTKCIKPECENLVAPTGIEPREGHHKNYRGLGACCKEHTNYQCGKCETVHSYSTKVGKAHMRHRVERQK